MAYKPSDHIPTRQGVLAAWILCAAIGALGLALPALSHAAPTGDEASKLSIAECHCTGAAPGPATLAYP